MNDNMNNDNKNIDEHADWNVDKLDPDNYLVIPEFGVMPESVQFKGFDCPLVYPGVPHREAAKSIRSMLRVARLQIRKRFNSYADVIRVFDEVFHIKGDGVEIDDPAEMTEDQREANFFMLIAIRLSQAAAPHEAEHARLASLADAANILSGWQLVSEHELPGTLAKNRGRSGGKKSGEKRAQKGIDARAVVAAARERGWPAKTYGVTQALSTKFDCSVRSIGKILAAEKKLSTEASSVPS